MRFPERGPVAAITGPNDREDLSQMVDASTEVAQGQYSATARAEKWTELELRSFHRTVKQRKMFRFGQPAAPESDKVAPIAI
jgi:hypothetical protein